MDACVVFAELLADAIEGGLRSEVLRSRSDGWARKIATIAAGSWRGKVRDRIDASGYVASALEAALWCVDRSPDYDRAVLHAANLARTPTPPPPSPDSWRGRSAGHRRYLGDGSPRWLGSPGWNMPPDLCWFRTFGPWALNATASKGGPMSAH